MKKKRLHVPISEEMHQQLSKYAFEHGISVSEAVRRFISGKLNLNDTKSTLQKPALTEDLAKTV